MTETELARSVVTELQRQGYETFEEVSTGYGSRRADVVGVRGPVTMVVECKCSLSLKLLDQMTAWLGQANYIIGAVESTRVGMMVRRYLQHEGFGLWTLAGDEIHEHIKPRLYRTTDAYFVLRRALRPEQRSGEFARAGSQTGGYWTPFRGTCRELLDVVQRHPGIELRAALQEITHHYASSKSAVSSLPGLIRKGVVAGLRIDVDGKRLRLFPVDTKIGAAVDDSPRQTSL